MQAYNLTRETWLARELKVADTFIRRLMGLLGKAGLAPAQGLWIKPCDSIHTFGMQFAIDVAFLDRQGEVVKLVEHLRPFRLMLPVARAASVIELPAGALATTQTRVGDRILIVKHQPSLHPSSTKREREDEDVQLESIEVAMASAEARARGAEEEPKDSDQWQVTSDELPLLITHHGSRITAFRR